MTTYEAYLAHVPWILLAVARVGGIFVFAPLFSASVIPARSRIALAFLLGLAIYPVAAGAWFEGTPPPILLSMLAPLVAIEIALGVAIGLIAAIPMLGIEVGSLMIGQQMGLRFAQIYNPASDTQSDVLGQMLFFLVLAGLIATGGLDAIVDAVMRTFGHVKPGTAIFDASITDVACGMLHSACEVGLRLSAPVLAVIFLESVAMGYVSKTTPQVNILSLGFPLRIIVGLATAWFGMAVIEEVSLDGLWEGLDEMHRWIGTLGTGEG